MQVLKSREGKTPVHVHPTAFKAKVAQIPTGGDPIEVPIGMRATREEYESAGAEFIPISGYQAITGGNTGAVRGRAAQGWATWDTRSYRRRGMIHHLRSL